MMWNRFMCWIGNHLFERNDTFMPRRRCVICKKQQGLFRGCGGDDWMDYPG